MNKKTIEDVKRSVSNPESVTQEIVDAVNRKDYIQLRVAMYPSIEEQMDMYYWDNVNGTSVAKDTITEVKLMFPKPLETDEAVLSILTKHVSMYFATVEEYEQYKLSLNTSN